MRATKGNDGAVSVAPEELRRGVAAYLMDAGCSQHSVQAVAAVTVAAEAEDNKNGGHPRGGELIIAISPDRLNGQAGEHAERLFRPLGCEDAATVRPPSSRRYADRKLSDERGIAIGPELASMLRIGPQHQSSDGTEYLQPSALRARHGPIRLEGRATPGPHRPGRPLCAARTA